jgi:hypothetical protein
MRIVIRAKLPHIAGASDFGAICARHGVSYRSVQDDGGDAANIVFELSNKVTAAPPERILRGLLDALSELAALDKDLAIKALDKHSHESSKPPVRSLLCSSSCRTTHFVVVSIMSEEETPQRTLTDDFFYDSDFGPIHLFCHKHRLILSRVSPADLPHALQCADAGPLLWLREPEALQSCRAR